LQSRIRKIIEKAEVPRRLNLTTQWERLNQGGLEELNSWLVEHPETRLIIVDTLQRIRATRKQVGNIYGEDYNDVIPFKELADKHNVAIIIVHHVNKSRTEDMVEAVSGSYGLTGGVDGIVVLNRGHSSQDGVFHVTGRDVAEQKLAVKWDAERGIWRLVGETVDVGEALSPARQQVSNLIRAEGRAMGPKEVAEALGQSYDAIRQLMSRMAKDGQLDSDGSGKYQISESLSHNGHNSHSLTYSEEENNILPIHQKIEPEPINGNVTDVTGVTAIDDKTVGGQLLEDDETYWQRILGSSPPPEDEDVYEDEWEDDSFSDGHDFDESDPFAD
jgi:hypothetical protein